MKETNIEPVSKTDELEQIYSNAIQLLGEDITRQGLVDTPKRVAKAMKFMLKGYNEDRSNLYRVEQAFEAHP